MDIQIRTRRGIARAKAYRSLKESKRMGLSYYTKEKRKTHRRITYNCFDTSVLILFS